jgi:hypothetical protein
MRAELEGTCEELEQLRAEQRESFAIARSSLASLIQEAREAESNVHRALDGLLHSIQRLTSVDSALDDLFSMGAPVFYAFCFMALWGLTSFAPFLRLRAPLAVSTLGLAFVERLALSALPHALALPCAVWLRRAAVAAAAAAIALVELWPSIRPRAMTSASIEPEPPARRGRATLRGRSSRPSDESPAPPPPSWRRAAARGALASPQGGRTLQ